MSILSPTNKNTPILIVDFNFFNLIAMPSVWYKIYYAVCDFIMIVILSSLIYYYFSVSMLSSLLKTMLAGITRYVELTPIWFLYCEIKLVLLSY